MSSLIPLNHTFSVWTAGDPAAVPTFTARYGQPPAHVLTVGPYVYLGPVPALETPPAEIPAHFLDDIAEVRNAH